MATLRSFATMLNEYAPNKLFKEELIKRNWLLNNIQKDDGWLTGSGITNTGLLVPFKGGSASSVAYGKLTATDDIAEDTFVRGIVNAPKEVWGSMIFKHRDLMEHGAVSEQNFLRVLPDAIKDFMDLMQNAVSTNLLNGSHIATLTSDGASGSIVVDRPDRFTIGQKIILADNNTAWNASSGKAYVTEIDMETNTLTIKDARSSGSAFNAAAYTVAQVARVYHDADASTSYFTSLRGSLLSSANGGDATLYGQTKTAYPYLQAIQVNGGSSGTNPLAVNAANIMEKIFEALVAIKQKGKGNPTKVVMSYKNLGSCMKVLEAQKGAFNVIPSDGKEKKAIQFGWMEIAVMAITGSVLTLVGVQECDDDIIMFLDMSAMTFYSNGFFQKRKNPDGREYFEERSATNGFTYTVDVCCFGELVLQRPSYCGIMYGISYT